MKIGDYLIPHALRQLAQDKEIQGMVLDLYLRRDKKDSLWIYLPYANKRQMEFAPKEELNEELREEGYDPYFKLKDTSLISELEYLNVLHRPEENNFFDDEDGSFIATVVIDKPDFIDYLYNWIKDSEYILNYGIFSLHKYTGEAYCEDNKYTFDTSKGLFRVMKAFLENTKHILTFNEIVDKFQGEHVVDYDPQRVYQAINDIKDKLKMTGKFSKLFLTSDGTYLLKSL